MTAVNLGALVLPAAMNAFAIPVAFTPNDGTPPFTGRGSYAYRETDLILDDGSALASVVISLGISLAEFPVIPKVGYALVLTPQNPPLSSFGPCSFTVDKVRPDGQGGATLVLKAGQPVNVSG
jgi:hypothetical protein